MRRIGVRILSYLIFILTGLIMTSVSFATASELVQQPTVSIPTVTGTQPGPIATVNKDNEQINVRSGPGVKYAKVGVLISGEQVPALGRSEGGGWVQITYPGVEDGIAWVYSPFVTLSIGSNLPIVEPPPLPTPLVTPTIDPTLAAQFIEDIPPTRLPTYTPPPPLVIPTFESEGRIEGVGRMPMGILIAVLGVIGLFGTLISVLRGR
jgi:hypothetical protein